MLGSLSKRQLMSSISRTKRFQPWQYVYQAQIQHKDRERYADDPNVRNTTPEHEKIIREGDEDALFLERLEQKRASKNSLWPKFDEEEQGCASSVLVGQKLRRVVQYKACKRPRGVYC